MSRSLRSAVQAKKTQAAIVAVAVSLSLLCVVLPVEAVVVPAGSPLQEKVYRHPNLHIPALDRRVTELGPALAPGLTRDLASLGAARDLGLYDWRGGRWGTLVLSRPFIPGTGKTNRLRWADLGAVRPRGDAEVQQRVRDALIAYLRDHQQQLRIDVAELQPPRVAIFEKGNLIQVHAGRAVAGVPVRDSGVTAIINHGNLILLGIQNWGAMEAGTTPNLLADDARAVVVEHLRPFAASYFAKGERLELIPTARGESFDAVAAGRGYDYRLAWVLNPRIAGDLESWEALVDAATGELIAFEDKNQYAARKVLGGVYPVSNDQRPPDGLEQTGWPMPYADVTIGASTSYADSGGNFTCAAGSAQTTLAGPFVRIFDTCGAVNETNTGDLDLGFGPTPTATDCSVPVGHSAGDTKSSRSGFYELNRLIEQAKGYLPTNTWLQSQLLSNMNINNNCNAFWGGSSVNFYQDQGSACRNTGEIAAIFDHEWGHGMDNNGVNTNISSPGEAIADIHAMMRLAQSCTGRGFFKNSVCGGYGDECDGTPATGCTGVRDLDYINHRCNLPHTITWAQSGFTAVQCPATGAPACPVGAGTPCGRETHCEGMVAAEAGWDLFARDLQSPPFSFDVNTALELATRLSFLGSQSLTAWYTCVIGGGCGATNGYMLFLAADDDNGDVTDGTPHMEAIRNAFQRHEIHCVTPTVANTGCVGGPTTAPTVLATPLDKGASVSWGSVPGASRYYVYRTEGVFGCNFGKVKVGETTGTSFFDQGLQNGRTYYYSVWPVGSSTSCFGLMSACATVVPAPGPNLRILDTAQVTVNFGDGDPFLDNCEQGVVGFTVENSGTGTLTNVRLVSVTPVTHPTTVVQTSLPALISASLADCTTANGSFSIAPQGMTFNQTTELRIEVTSDELFPQTRSQIVRIAGVESDTQPVASQTYGFDADLQGWQVASGTFTREPGGALGTGFHVSSSVCLDDQCDDIRSPAVLLRSNSTLSLYNRYDTETPIPIPYDRANVGLLDALGTRTTVVPDGGKLYDLPPGAPNGACVTGNQAGWSAKTDTDCIATAGFLESTWSSSALNPGGAFTGRSVNLSVAYGTDPAVFGWGFDFDQVTLTNFDLQIPDAQPDACSAVMMALTTSASTVAESVGTAPMVVRVTTLNGQTTPAQATVQYATADGTASSGFDYTSTSGTLTFGSGTANGSTQTVNVPILNDVADEGSETFTLGLSSPSGGGLGASTHTATITDNDLPVADFDLNDQADILFRHAVSGKNVVWFMDGITRTAGVFTNPDQLPDTNWRMVGTNDFSSDGKTDIVFRHAVSGKNVVWYMDGITRTQGVFTNPDVLPDTNWRIVGTGDFSTPLDGKPDFLFRHAVSGKNVAWYMDGITRTQGVFTNPDVLADTNWQMVGVGDFSKPGDSRTDILWRHVISGKNVVWYMNGITRTAGVFTNPDQLPDTNWRMVAVGDYSGDHRPDIVFRHAISGKNVVWFMDGITRTQGVFTNPSQLPDTNWQIVGPR